LMGAAGAVAGKLRALAKRIGARLAAVGRGIARGAKWVASGATRVVRATGKLARRAATKVGDKWFLVKNRRLAHKGMAWIDASGDRCIRHGPMNEGPLNPKVAATFRSSSYTSRKLGEPKELWRAYSDPDKKLGAYWTDIPPS